MIYLLARKHIEGYVHSRYHLDSLGLLVKFFMSSFILIVGNLACLGSSWHHILICLTDRSCLVCVLLARLMNVV